MTTTVMPSLPTFSAVNNSTSHRPRTTLLVKSFHGTQSQIISSPYFPHPQNAEPSTQRATKSPPIHKSLSATPPHVYQVTSSTQSSSILYVLAAPSTLKTTKSPHKPLSTTPLHVNQVISSSKSSSTAYIPTGKPSPTDETFELIVLVASAVGGSVFLILFIILCCCIHRRLKRKKNERIFQKYYRPTIPSNSPIDSDLESEDDNSNKWESQMKLTVEDKEKQSVDPTSFQGFSNKAFIKSESLPEMNIIEEKLPSDLPADIPNDTEESISNNGKGFSVQEVDKSSTSEDGPDPEKTEPEKPLSIGDVISIEENSLECDNARASLLILQNLDDVLNNECLADEDTSKKEIPDVLADDHEEKKDEVEHFVVLCPFVMSNADEISLDTGTAVSVVASKPSGWSWVANQNGDTGWFPTQYLAKDKSADDTSAIQCYSIPDLKRLQFAVLQSFSGSSPDELSLKKYDIVSVIENNPSGWSWVSEPSAGSGWYPTSYLEPLVFPKNDKSRSASSEDSDYLDVIDEDIQYIYASSEEIQKVKNEGRFQELEAKVYRASHAYTGGNEDELTFKENETILVLQETNSGWWRGSTYLGEGWFPATFVEDPVSTAVSDETSDDESYEYVVDPKHQDSGVSPYKVTEIVTNKNTPNKKANREIVHQVPQPISSKAAEQHKSRGKTPVLRPRRPPPPPPPSEHPPASQLSPEQLNTTPTHSSVPLSLPVNTVVPPQSPHPTATPLSATPHPIPPPRFPISPVSQKPPLVQNSQIDEQKNEDSKEPGDVEGVVIVRPHDKSADTLSKLIKVTKRRSLIDPNPCELPPNRPVPIPPPRQTRKSRPRPIKTPRKLSNKKLDKPSIKNVPEHGPERPPPPLPERLPEFPQKRPSSSDESSSGQKLTEEQLPRKPSASYNAKVSPIPQPRRRSQEQIALRSDLRGYEGDVKPERRAKSDVKGTSFENTTATPNSISQSSRKSSSSDHNSDSVPPKTPPRSHSLSDETPENIEPPRTRPVIKPRSKSLGNLFSSAGDEGNSDQEATSESQERYQNPSDESENSVFHEQIVCDNNQNITKDKSIKSLNPPSRRNPPKPRPKTRTKQSDREIQV